MDLFVGTYANPGGRGLYRLAVSADGALALGDCIAPARNASFGAVSGGLHYLTDECDSRLGIWQHEGGGWQQLAKVGTAGQEPCYVALDEQRRRLAVANYKSGSLALFKFGGDGLPVEPPVQFQDSGTGPVNGRQDGPHMHCVRFSPDGTSLYAVDLGADHVLRFPLDGAGLAEPILAYKAPAGSGPRHLLLHPSRPFALLISELACTLTLLAIDSGRLTPLATCPTSTADRQGPNAGGHLAWPSTSQAYVSNRGHDTVALIEIDLDRARLTPIQHVPSGGRSPRHFLLSGARMVVAHEKDGTVASFLFGEGGRLRSTGHAVHIPGSCYVFEADKPVP